jgi:hypothetical protein
MNRLIIELLGVEVNKSNELYALFPTHKTIEGSFCTLTVAFWSRWHNF